MAVKTSGVIVGTIGVFAAAAVIFQQTAVKKVSAAASGKGQLVLYSAQGYDQAMATAFQNATGIQVKLVDDSTGNLVAKMEAERANPHWDVAWFDGDSTMQSLDNEGMLKQHWAPNDIGNYNALGKQFLSKDQSYYPTGLTAAAAIGYNSKLVSKKDAPHDWSDLLKPVFHGAVAMNDPSISGPTFPYVAGMLQSMGDSQGRQFYTNLKKNGLKVFPTNGNTVQALETGKVKAVTIQDTALLKAKLAGEPIQLVYPKSGVYSLPSVIGLNRNAPDAANAVKFVEFVLSPKGQKIMLDAKNGGSDSYYNPIIKGVRADSVRQQTGVKWVTVNPIRAAQNESQIKTWFHENIVQ